MQICIKNQLSTLQAFFKKGGKLTGYQHNKKRLMPKIAHITKAATLVCMLNYVVYRAVLFMKPTKAVLCSTLLMEHAFFSACLHCSFSHTPWFQKEKEGKAWKRSKRWARASLTTCLSSTLLSLFFILNAGGLATTPMHLDKEKEPLGLLPQISGLGLALQIYYCFESCPSSNNSKQHFYLHNSVR